MDPTATRLNCDLLVVGGGVNGTGIARDAAGRGLSVVLCEQDDLAAHTSSSSTKLVHGGLRYLEHLEFGLVRKALIERERLLASAPHVMRPLRFVMPHVPSMRPAWLMRLGVLLYDHLAPRRALPGSEAIDLARHPAGGPLAPGFSRGFAYSDGWVDDARLVTLCAVDAAERGAVVLTRTRCTDARRGPRGWQASLRPALGPAIAVQARAVVNAAGPWAARFLHDCAHVAGRRGLRLVRGSHLVVPRLHDQPTAYVLQGADRRIAFAIPYERRFTLIGTTEVEHRGDPGEARASDDEVAYLCALANRYFRAPIAPSDVVWSFAGVRPLLDARGDASAISRDYALELDDDGPPLLTVWGGKITTFRRLAEEAVDRVAGALGAGAGAWTADAPLPGGDLPVPPALRRSPELAFERFRDELLRARPWLPRALGTRLARAYGARVERVLGGAAALADLGEPIAPGLFEAEARYLMREEWARSADDLLWRRSKLALHLSPAERLRVARWVEARAGSERGAAHAGAAASMRRCDEPR